MIKVCVIGVRGVPLCIGGIETICRELYPLIYQLSTDWDITILARNTVSEKSYTYKGIKIKVIPALTLPGLENFVHTFVSLIYARLFLHPKLVHLHGIGPGFFSWFARLLGFKTIVTHHAQDYLRPKWGFAGRSILRLGEIISCIFANKVICVSESLQIYLDQQYRFLRSKRVVIRNAGSLNFDAVQSDLTVLERMELEPKKYILAVGRLDETKAFHELIEAYNLAQIQNYKLVIVGGGHGTTAYIRKLEKLSSDNVVFAGSFFDDDLAAIYRNAALLVNPSHMEGYCLVVAEALSANLPVLVSDIPPHREFGLPGECFFNVGDVAALARKISVEDYEIYYSVEASKKQMLNTWQSNAEKHVQLFTEMIR
ncbi:glycosyltransferase family 4 protein [Alteromonas pelagimontana]|uniref:Glycosyltransferase family 4 protein n=1 Tax=Alteromonas pelagimontana TaxID=1858656 RepID=A0A6M4MBJ5_9ALTE|nr:glycosyltransferase family 4 protein [Alteromonas pelagimontana]QJR80178.1 glycosyltransferase family 4 protein [Alteromonas pelagimontana]